MRWLWLIFGVLWLSLTGWFSYWALNSYREQMRAHRSYLPVSARVLKSEVKTLPGTGSSPDTYMPSVRYEFEVGDKRYIAERLHFLGSSYNDIAEARRRLERFPVGAKVTAYYDPDDPERAVLDNSAPGRAGAFLAAALGVFWLAGLGAVAYGLWPFLRGLRRTS